MCVSVTCVQRASWNAGCGSGIEGAVLHTAEIQYSIPLWRKYMANSWWVLKLKQRSFLFSLLLLPLLFLSFSFLSTLLFFGGAFGPKDLWKSVTGFVSSSLVSFSVQKFCSSLVVGTNMCSGQEAAWKFSRSFVN